MRGKKDKSILWIVYVFGYFDRSADSGTRWSQYDFGDTWRGYFVRDYITPSQYSNIAMFTLLVSFFSAFIGINAHGAISRKFVDKDEIDISIYIENVIFVLLGSIIVLIPFIFIFI